MVDHVNTPAVTVAATTTSAANAYGASGGGNGVWIYKSGTVAIHVKSGASTVTATTSDQVIPAGQARTLKKNSADTHLAIRTASSTATAYFHGTAL